MRNVMEMFDLTGKVALVTGSESGIGQGIATGLAEAGADIIGTYWRDYPKETESMVTAVGRKFCAVQVDFSVPENRKQFLADLLPAHEKIDILINAAGTSGLNPVPKFDFNDYNRVIEINLNTALDLSVAICQRWVKEGTAGRIINITSLASVCAANAMLTPYCVSKHGLLGLTRSFAYELGPKGITVNALAPGFIKTQMTTPNKQREDAMAATIAKVPVGRWGFPEDFKGIAVLLASDAGSFINGRNIVVDGGYTLE